MLNSAAAQNDQRQTCVLEVDHVSIELGMRAILQDVTFRVPRGTALAVIGPNGCGKTVLFRALIGAIPFKGTIRWASGVRFGYVPQKLDIERNVPITGQDFLRAHPKARGAWEKVVGDALTMVGLPRHACQQSIGAMSGGQFQRLLMAFALIGGPDVLLLDEPTSGVDEPGEERLNNLVHRLQDEQGITVLFISHELSVVSRYATNVLCLNRERVWFGPPAEILTPDRLRELYGMPLAFHLHGA